MYSNRATWVASWAPRRIYPHQEPTFEAPVSSNPTPLRRSATNASGTTESAGPPADSLATTTPSSAPSAAPNAPPPMYFPGAAQLARTRTQAGASGPVVLTHFTSVPATIAWSSHPTRRESRWAEHIWGRPAFWWRCLVTRDRETLARDWPRAFDRAGVERRSTTGAATSLEDAEEGRVSSDGSAGVTRTMSVGSAGTRRADSAIALTPRSTIDLQRAHALAPLFQQRIDTVNKVVGDALVPTRIVLAGLEVLNLVWLLTLLVALGVEKGKQGGFLKGVEVSLVLVIILNGTGMNWVRMKRWTLSKELRIMSRDWSPLPLTSSTNQGLLNNFLGEVDHEALEERMRGKEQPSIRWSMRRFEGSWWLSYRPIVKCELVTPKVTRSTALLLPTPTVDIEVEPERAHVPPYVA